MADLRNQQVTLQRRVTADFKVRQPQLALLIFQAAFDAPATERHVQDHRQGHAGGRVAEEVFDLARLKHVAGHDQPIRSHHVFTARPPASRELHFPHYRALVRVLEVIRLPRLILEHLSIPADVLDRQSGGQRYFASASFAAAISFS